MVTVILISEIWETEAQNRQMSCSEQANELLKSGKWQSQNLNQPCPEAFPESKPLYYPTAFLLTWTGTPK